MGIISIFIQTAMTKCVYCSKNVILHVKSISTLHANLNSVRYCVLSVEISHCTMITH